MTRPLWAPTPLPATRLTFQEERDKDVGGLRVAQYYLLGQQQNLDCPASDLAEAQETLLPRMEAMLGTLPAGPLSAFLLTALPPLRRGRSFSANCPERMISAFGQT